MIKRRRFKQSLSLIERLAAASKSALEAAALLPPGPEKEVLLERARQSEAAINMTQWLRAGEKA